MKKWNNAEIVDLSINETAHNWTGIYRDGGYIGDGQISGHGTWCKNESVGCKPVCPTKPGDSVNGQS